MVFSEQCLLPQSIEKSCPQSSSASLKKTKFLHDRVQFWLGLLNYYGIWCEVTYSGVFIMLLVHAMANLIPLLGIDLQHVMRQVPNSHFHLRIGFVFRCLVLYRVFADSFSFGLVLFSYYK